MWHSLIAGARGIIYFNHSFGGPCITQNVLRSSCGSYPAIRTMVTSVNAQIQSIAGALNGPKLTSGFSANANVKAAAKWDGQNIYVLAGSAENGGPFQSQFSIPCVGNATATVLGENRTVPITAGVVVGHIRRRQRRPHLPHRRRLDLRAAVTGRQERPAVLLAGRSPRPQYLGVAPLYGAPHSRKCVVDHEKWRSARSDSP